jgi:hypothetical protein
MRQTDGMEKYNPRTSAFSEAKAGEEGKSKQAKGTHTADCSMVIISRCLCSILAVLNFHPSTLPGSAAVCDAFSFVASTLSLQLFGGRLPNEFSFPIHDARAEGEEVAVVCCSLMVDVDGWVEFF